ncbi:uncharacterized protein [Musca autumnalis]|uniref:uncharacterized protein n=1 Tax=Musca autumnalis TaxID=221902 RepID=UPI003CF259B8
MEFSLNFSAKMLFNDFCLKIYFWPFLSYLANIKGICPPTGSPIPPTIIPPYTIPTIPTYQPTPPLPTTTTMAPTTTTLPPCPAVPLVCLANGDRPIAYCPCIDPRQQMSAAQQQQMAAIEVIMNQPTAAAAATIQQPLTLSQLTISHSSQPVVDNQQALTMDQLMTSDQLIALQQQMNEQQTSGGQTMTSEQLLEMLDTQSLEFRSAAAKAQSSGSEMMVFSHLPNSRRRKRQYAENKIN